jgi:hypothetical protein
MVVASAGLLFAFLGFIILGSLSRGKHALVRGFSGTLLESSGARERFLLPCYGGFQLLYDRGLGVRDWKSKDSIGRSLPGPNHGVGNVGTRVLPRISSERIGSRGPNSVFLRASGRTVSYRRIGEARKQSFCSSITFSLVGYAS